ncbi:hypothetical protein GB931_09475 [Modestobacter sp. I12A-02628]|uniref:Uncharacterized protein n=1 Tax=Goekera deserti TaxID=2497753 RepID=A0A7K3WJD9_9ACTN|nr:hypothetical protein [Goekera deserti]MPQ98146.1 hypothetical protein [Goekera deserti]NDI48795.1 hypothetical protein [Goekera deserti]NEL56476.1 hypothetical protein [Goekera deserti]
MPTTSPISVQPFAPTVPMSQDVVATEAAEHLRRADFLTECGTFGNLTTAEVLLADGRRLVLVPMVETLYGDFEDPDVDLWHLLLRDSDGTYLELSDDTLCVDECPSVLWAQRMGVDPAVAVHLVVTALADADVWADLGLSA